MSQPAHAQSVYELRNDVAVDLTVTLGAAAVLALTETYKDHLAPQRCRWCDTNGKGEDVLNPVDEGMRNLLRWRDPSPARHMADTLAFMVAPTGSIGTMLAASTNDRAEIKFPTDMLLTAEAVMLAAVLNQGLKFLLARERPFVHVMTEDEKKRQSHPSDNNLSFYSGHTSLTFAIATASGTIASLRNYRLKSMVWGTLVPMAALTGYLRIAGDRHYFVDVLTGAVLGSAVGILVPLVFHGRDGLAGDTTAALTAGPGPIEPMVTFSGKF
ncbi:MAG: phosphatase PAP2 family protein [Deltaproteobacteria bacterium]|nr:phosphatase PAP2 family protein [Deltaproteobacteria bacterium]